MSPSPGYFLKIFICICVLCGLGECVCVCVFQRITSGVSFLLQTCGFQWSNQVHIGWSQTSSNTCLPWSSIFFSTDTYLFRLVHVHVCMHVYTTVQWACTFHCMHMEARRWSKIPILRKTVYLLWDEICHNCFWLASCHILGILLYLPLPSVLWLQ